MGFYTPSFAHSSPSPIDWDAVPVVVAELPHKAAGSLEAIVQESAGRNGVPAELILRIIRVESRGNCRASNGIAFGVMQVQRATALSVGVGGNLMDCRNGVEAGVRYLRLALNRVGGDWAKAATLYNAGIYARIGRSRYSQLVLN